jgi:hypothetical protein
MKGELMPDQLSGSDRLPAGNLARVVGVVALAAVVVIHSIDRPSTLRAIPLIGYGYVVLIAAALVVASPLVTVPEQRVDAGPPDGIRGHPRLCAPPHQRTAIGRFAVGYWNGAMAIAAISTQALIVLLAFGGLRQPRLRRPGAHSDIDAQDSLLRAPADFTG